MDKRDKALELTARSLGLAFGALCGIQVSGIAYNKKGLDEVVDKLKENIDQLTVLMREIHNGDDDCEGATTSHTK